MVLAAVLAVTATLVTVSGLAQLPDRTRNPNAANEGIAKSFNDQIGAGRGSQNTPNSSRFIIARDPFRAIRRGRQIFQRKFLRSEGQGPITGEGDGKTDIQTDLAIGAGLADSCASCHGLPRGSAGFGGDVVTRPDSRNAPHLFGLGIKEMLADEITDELRDIRRDAIEEARALRRNVTKTLRTSSRKGSIRYGTITARPDGSVDTSGVDGVDSDLRVRPFFLHGETISIREFLVGAFNAEMGLEANDPDLRNSEASGGQRVVTPAGMVLDGRIDQIEQPPVNNTSHDADNDGVVNEIPTSIVDFMEFYLLHYFKPGTGEGSPEATSGRSSFTSLGCAACHIPDLTIDDDRRVADVDTVFDSARGNPFNRLFATAIPSFTALNDGTGFPTLKRPNLGSFVVRNIFTDFKRHDLGPNFHEINFDGTIRTQFLTMPLWGVGTSANYGHDGRSHDLMTVILRHGGEAQQSRDNFANASAATRRNLIAFLNTLILFPPDDTSSTLDTADSTTPGYPQFGHGSIRLGALFNNPNDPE
ncbi:MAG TPA: di-heme oxidoredictase family protein [Pyrinomonadaceae bacterium]|nr:di-heme oxidoredictase family protein [Pyrinomonadaceae bacterium]